MGVVRSPCGPVTICGGRGSCDCGGLREVGRENQTDSVPAGVWMPCRAAADEVLPSRGGYKC